MTDERRIYWLPAGPNTLASSRLHVYTIHAYLQGRGWHSDLLYQPVHILQDAPLRENDITRTGLFRAGDVVVFQKLNGPMTVSAINHLKRRMVVTVFVDCDYPPKLGAARASSLTICSSDELAGHYRRLGIANVFAVPEAYEAISPPQVQITRRLTCVWFGSMNIHKAKEIDWLRSLLRQHLPAYRLVVVSDAPMADYQWKLPDAWRIIANCDVAVITGNDSEATLCKSSNRLIQAMALGLPVVAYPIPAYRNLIRSGVNGYLCATDIAWVGALKNLESADHRLAMASTGFRYARRYFAIDRVGLQWERLIRLDAHPIPALSLVQNFSDTIWLSFLRFKIYRRLLSEINVAQRPLRLLRRIYLHKILGIKSSEHSLKQ